MHWHSLPAARGCAVGRPRCRAAAHPPLRPPTLAYSPICPPRSSRSLEPPEEHGHRSRGSRGGWCPDRRGCPGSRGSRPPRRRRPLVAPQLSWPILVVSLRLGARPGLWGPPALCAFEFGLRTLTVAYGSGFRLRLSRWRPSAARPKRAVVPTASGHLRCPLGEKGSF